MKKMFVHYRVPLAIIIVASGLVVGVVKTASTFAATPAPAATPTAAVCSVIQSTQKADDYWIAHNSATSAKNDWITATFEQGNIAFYNLTKNTKYYNYAESWAKAHKFAIQNSSTKPFFPDLQAVGQAYLDLYAIDHKGSELTSLRSRINAEVASVQKGNVSYVNYVDALNMALPNFARLGILDNSSADLSALQTLFNYTEKVDGGHGLYDTSAHLWWRDANYVNTTTLWSRGNGWAFMAMVKLISALPQSDPRRPEFVAIFQQMAAALIKIQRSDGFWNVDLGNAKDFPGPESSGTAFFTYGLAWGINNSFLSASTYMPAVTAGWHGLVTKALHSNGFLGYVQGTGSKPSDHQPVTTNDTGAYGVGGFLLAGVQVARLTPGC
jgi:unsaturated rhamnogalacturonyl hydrolase